MLKIQVKIKTVYGNDLIYPVCDKAVCFTKLVRQDTLTTANIILIKQLGYEIEVISDRPNKL